MTEEQRERLMQLCARIQVETSRTQFMKLVYELNVLLEERQDALEPEPKAAAPS